MTIYAVTKGIYSDYHIITATTDKDLAEKIAEKFSDRYYDASVEVFEDAEMFIKPCFLLRYDEDGRMIKLENRDDEYSYTNWEGVDITNCFSTTVIADNLETAIKIGAEKRARFLAEQDGLC